MIVEERVSKGYENRKSAHSCRHRLLEKYSQRLIVRKDSDDLYYVWLRRNKG